MALQPPINMLTAVALAQFSPKQCGKDQNIKTMSEWVKKARHHDADLVIFPELSLTGYICSKSCLKKRKASEAVGLQRCLLAPLRRTYP